MGQPQKIYIQQPVSARYTLRDHDTPQQREITAELVTELTPSPIDTFTDSTIFSPIIRINFDNYKIIYSTYFKVPLAVHELITKDLMDGDAARTDFYPDQHINPKFRVSHDQYRKSKAFYRFNINRGHMAAAGNYSGNEEAKKDTFTFANIVPQNARNNSGIWNTFQRYSRSLLSRNICDSIQIISGPIYSKDQPYLTPQGQTLDNVYKQQSTVLTQNGVLIPDRLYKIIKCNSKSGPYLNAFQFQNRPTQDNHRSLNEYGTTLDRIEEQTGLEFHLKGGDLKEVDAVGLGQSKLAWDREFYQDMLAKAKSVRQYSYSLSRAKEEQIPVDTESLEEHFNRLVQTDLELIGKKENSGYCRKLNDLMNLNKELFYLWKLPAYEERITKQEQPLIQQCFDSKESELQKPYYEKVQKKNARNIAKKSSKFVFINQQKINDVFAVAEMTEQDQSSQSQSQSSVSSSNLSSDSSSSSE